MSFRKTMSLIVLSAFIVSCNESSKPSLPSVAAQGGGIGNGGFTTYLTQYYRLDYLASMELIGEEEKVMIQDAQNSVSFTVNSTPIEWMIDNQIDAKEAAAALDCYSSVEAFYYEGSRSYKCYGLLADGTQVHRMLLSQRLTQNDWYLIIEEEVQSDGEIWQLSFKTIAYSID